MHKVDGIRDPALAFPLDGGRHDAADRRQANRAVAVSALGLGLTGAAELLIALLTGSVGLLGDAIHNLSDVSTSAVVFLGFRLSRRPPTDRYPLRRRGYRGRVAGHRRQPDRGAVQAHRRPPHRISHAGR
ncbi:MAG: cation transporter [Streptosporangiaceae bacterium]